MLGKGHPPPPTGDEEGRQVKEVVKKHTGTQSRVLGYAFCVLRTGYVCRVRRKKYGRSKIKRREGGRQRIQKEEKEIGKRVDAIKL